MKYIDLTLQVGKTNKIYKWAEIQLKKEMVMGHVGTHIDVYEKKRIPLEYMQRRGVVFDVSHIKDREITSDDVDLDYIKKGDFILFRTGAIEKYPYGSGLYFSGSPVLSWELIHALIDERISFIGMDAPDLRKGPEHIEADKLCEKNGIYVVENLMNLNQINPEEVCKVLTMWHEDTEATGLRCRVVATQP
ncbi:MAG: cyclase family protein [Cellulosilyticaceae bacterium]